MGKYFLYALGVAVIAMAVAAAMYWQARGLRRNRQRAGDGVMLRTLIDNLPDLIYVKDADGRFLLANAAVARVMGAKSPADLLGKNDFDFFPRDLASRYHEDEQAVIRSGNPLLEREEECRDPSGALMYLRTTKIPLRDSAGGVTGLVGIGRDTTLRTLEAKALDAAVLESQAVMQAVLSGAGDQRIPMAGKTGSLERLADSINQLIDGLSKTVAEAVQIVQKAVAGDLTARMEANDKPGDLKVLALSVNSLIQAMMEVVVRLRKSSLAILDGAEQISRGNRNLSQRTEEQSSHLVETASSMEEMTSTVTNSAENAAQANQLAVAAREQAERGGQVVSSAVAAMSEINAASEKMADIIGVINGIAFQTKLLALNAAVEAARAAEHGKGFAVVASEVRNLAARSTEAAKEIESLIQDSVRKVNDGSKLIEVSGKVLDEIVTRAKKVADMMAELSSSSREQASGIEQVNKAVTAMDSMTQQNADLAEQAAATAQTLTEQATELTNLTSHYRLS